MFEEGNVLQRSSRCLEIAIIRLRTLESRLFSILMRFCRHTDEQCIMGRLCVRPSVRLLVLFSNRIDLNYTWRDGLIESIGLIPFQNAFFSSDCKYHRFHRCNVHRFDPYLSTCRFLACQLTFVLMEMLCAAVKTESIKFRKQFNDQPIKMHNIYIHRSSDAQFTDIFKHFCIYGNEIYKTRQAGANLHFYAFLHIYTYAKKKKKRTIRASCPFAVRLSACSISPSIESIWIKFRSEVLSNWHLIPKHPHLT